MSEEENNKQKKKETNVFNEDELSFVKDKGLGNTYKDVMQSTPKKKNDFKW